MELQKQIDNLRLVITEILPECHKQELFDEIILMNCLVGVRETLHKLQEEQDMMKV